MRTSAPRSKTALVISYSDIPRDPRVYRQIEWLTSDGWDVDVIGLGTEPPVSVRDTFTLTAPAKWLTSKIGYVVAGAILPRRFSFRRQLLDRVPKVARERVKRGEYDLIVLNEVEFLPWLASTKSLGAALGNAHIHVDLHEKHRPDRRRNTLGAKLASPYYRWQYRQIANPHIDTRTVVNEEIGNLYVRELGIETPTPSRNVPAYEDIQPVERGDGKIKLLFHGMGSNERGLQQIVDAMSLLPKNFEAYFMIMPDPATHAWLQSLIKSSPARERMAVVPPAPMLEIAKRINEYDVEVVYLPPLKDNLKYASPNKFYEAVQGRLALAVRDDLTMAPWVRKWDNGIVVPGHSGSELAASLKGLTPDEVLRMKNASHVVAQSVNAEAEGRRFLEIVS